MIDCFTCLGIDSDASVDEIKRRYKELSLVHHPDRGGDALTFNTLNKAYKKAMAIASKPKPCARCNNTRKIIIQNGFFATKMPCPDCSKNRV